ncbi:MAG: TetR family transcriptional regulator [Bacteroidales bacterium]|nr:TetR family transcriptional regulator [Bacteroidales bacterium]
MNTRETILTQSFQLFLNEGYKEVSINKIIQICEISKGAFYHYFESKDDLYTQVLDRFFFSYFQSSDFVYDDSISFQDKLNQFIVSFVTPYEELLLLSSRNDLIHYFRFLFQAAGHSPSIKYKVNKHFYKKAYYLASIIKEEQDDNQIRKQLNTKNIARQLLSIVLGTTLLDGIYDASIIKKHLLESIELYIVLLKGKSE